MNQQAQPAQAKSESESASVSESAIPESDHPDAQTTALLLKAIEIGYLRLEARIKQVERKAGFEEETDDIERRLNRIEARIDRVCEQMERLEGITRS